MLFTISTILTTCFYENCVAIESETQIKMKTHSSNEVAKKIQVWDSTAWASGNVFTFTFSSQFKCLFVNLFFFALRLKHFHSKPLKKELQKLEDALGETEKDMITMNEKF